MGFFSLLAVIAGGGIGLIALFLILLALPRSPMRDFTLQMMLWVFVVGCAVLVASPIDFVPFLPIDDLFTGSAGVGAAALAVYQRMQAKALPTGADDVA